MKKHIIIFAMILSAFSSYALGYFNVEDEISIIEELMNERIGIINDFLYNEQDFLKLKTSLEKIEKEKIYLADIDVLSRVINNPTEYEKANHVSIENVIEINSDENEIEIIAVLKWRSEGFEGKKNIINTYNISCVKENKKIYLTSIKNIE